MSIKLKWQFYKAWNHILCTCPPKLMLSWYIWSTKWIVVLVGSVDNVLGTLMLWLRTHRGTKVKLEPTNLMFYPKTSSKSSNVIRIHRDSIAFLGSQNNEIKMRYLQFKTWRFPERKRLFSLRNEANPRD